MTESPPQATPAPSAPAAHSGAPAPDARQQAAAKFVRSLKQLEARDDGPARAAMASLRSGLRQPDGVAPAMLPFVVPLLPDHQSPLADHRYFQVAALFALHPLNTDRGSFGTAYRLMQDKGSASIERRFQAILAAHEDELFRHLTQAVQLFKSQNIPVNWRGLLLDLTLGQWNSREQRIQLRWARDYYRSYDSRLNQAGTPDTE